MATIQEKPTSDIVELELDRLDDEENLVAIIYLNRPESLNAISWDMVLGLEEVLNRIEAEPRVRAALITGRGRAFSAGGDLKAYLSLQQDNDAFPRFMDDLMRTFSSIGSMDIPVVALVNGVTVAGGIELMLACDFAYAAASARIGDGHLNFGQMGGGGALSRLPRALGPAKARELIFSAELLDAETAREWGLVNRVFPDDELIEAGLEFARGVATRSARAIASAKYVMHTDMAAGIGLHASMRLERERTALYCLTYPDSREGLLAFSQKRRPRYGRVAADDDSDGSSENGAGDV